MQFEDDDKIDMLGTYKDVHDHEVTYSLWLDQPLGWQGGDAGNFVLTEEVQSGYTGGGSKELSGHFELKKIDEHTLEIHLIPETVVEAFWDEEMGEGEQEARYKYEGEKPMVVTVDDVTPDDNVIRAVLIKAFGKDLRLERE